MCHHSAFLGFKPAQPMVPMNFNPSLPQPLLEEVLKRNLRQSQQKRELASELGEVNFSLPQRAIVEGEA